MDWRQCLQSYLDSLDAGESHTTIKDHQTTLRNFFAQFDPATVQRSQIEAFCKQPGERGAPSSQTIKRRKSAIRNFYTFAQEQGYQGDNPALPPAKEEKPLFQDESWELCYQSFLKELRNKSGSETTVVSYSNVLERFFRDRDPLTVTRSAVSLFIDAPTQSPWAKSHTPAASTRNARTSIIKAFYDFAAIWTISKDGQASPLYSYANPCTGIRHGQPARSYKTLTLDEIEKFFNCMSDPTNIFHMRDRAALWLYTLTCRRRSELALLRWGQIELGTVNDKDGRIRQAYTVSFRGKGKSGIADRQEIPQKCMDDIRAYLELTGRWGKMKAEDPVFLAHPNQHGPSSVRPGEERPLSSKGLVNRLKLYCRQAGIDERKLSMHALRHTGSYLRILAGEDTFSLSRTLRHKSLQTTQIYMDGLITSADRGGDLVTSFLAQRGIQ